jgi:ABC-type branched-subunit amino acid transport system substrate-binding protein
MKFKIAVATAGTLLFGMLASAQTKTYDTGATDTEIKVGQTMPYSGPLSGYGTIGKLQSAYVRMVNESGGVNGREIDLISLDDSYSPPKTVERTRKLVEDDGILFTFMAMGTPTNSAIHKYLNSKEIPMLFVASGATKWNDPRGFPWTTGWQQSYRDEGYEFGVYVRKAVTEPHIAILKQNDDLGKDFVAGFREGLGADADKLIVRELTYQVADPTIDSQIVTLQSTGANVFFDVAVSKFAAQAIRKMGELKWAPLHLLISNSASVAGTLSVAGLEKSKGTVSFQTYKDPLDPNWKSDSGVKEYLAFMKANYPEGDPGDEMNAYAYSGVQLLVELVRRCGNDLTRANVLHQATSIDSFPLPMLLPGVVVNTSADKFNALTRPRLARFDGQHWQLID